MIPALLLAFACPVQDLSPPDLAPGAGSGETVLVALPDASETGRALEELFEDLAPLDEALELRRHVIAAGSHDAARLREGWRLGAGSWTAILRPGEEVATCAGTEFPGAFLERVVRPRLSAALRPEGVRLLPGKSGVDVLVAFEATASVGETCRVELAAGWIGPDPVPRRSSLIFVGESCDVPDDFSFARPGVRAGAGSPLAPRPVPDLFLFADATGPAPRPETRELAVRGAVFDPWVLVVPAGSTVRYVNRDACSHALHVRALRNASTNRSLAPEAEVEQVYERAETVLVQDDLHPWMEAWVVVTDSPHHAASGADGRAVIEAPPVGLRGLRLWHPDPRVPAGYLPVEVLPGDDLRVHAWMFESGPSPVAARGGDR